jgi:hypothetical protein
LRGLECAFEVGQCLSIFGEADAQLTHVRRGRPLFILQGVTRFTIAKSETGCLVPI